MQFSNRASQSHIMFLLPTAGHRRDIGSVEFNRRGKAVGHSRASHANRSFASTADHAAETIHIHEGRRRGEDPEEDRAELEADNSRWYDLSEERRCLMGDSVRSDCISSTAASATGDLPTGYGLHGVVFHIGDGAMKGHYTTAIRDGDAWFYIDDSNVFLLQGPQSTDWLLNSSSADIPMHLLLSADLKATAPRSACVSGKRSAYLIFYSKN